jgi:toxin ParE1/3/4
LIHWSKLASVQFKAIHDYIAKDSLRSAQKQSLLIMEAIDQLERFSRSGRAGNSSIKRELVVSGTPYIVYYRLKDDAVELASIRHAARKKPRRFSE